MPERRKIFEAEDSDFGGEAMQILSHGADMAQFALR